MFMCVKVCVCVLTEVAMGQGKMGGGLKMCCWTAVCWNRTGYMELCCVCVCVCVYVCVLTDGALVQGRMGERIEDMLLDSCMLEQDRIYGVIFCVFNVRACVGKRENGGA